MWAACDTPPPYTHKCPSMAVRPNVFASGIRSYMAVQLDAHDLRCLGYHPQTGQRIPTGVRLANARTRLQLWVCVWRPPLRLHLQPQNYETSLHLPSSQLVILKPLEVKTFISPHIIFHVRPLALPPATNVPLCGAVSRKPGCGIYSKLPYRSKATPKAIICGVGSLVEMQ